MDYHGPSNGAGDSQRSNVATEAKEAMLVQVEARGEDDHGKKDVAEHLVAKGCLTKRMSILMAKLMKSTPTTIMVYFGIFYQQTYP